MKCSALLMAVVVLLAGCRSPTSSWNFFAPYGATRVPPPSTGAYNRPDTYYQPSTIQPGAPANQRSELARSSESALASDVRESRTTAASPAGAFVQRDERQASADSPLGERDEPKVKLASGTRSDAPESPIRIVEGGQPAASARLELKGMPVNDATRPASEAVPPAEPRQFEPPADARDMSQLPKPPAGAASQTSAAWHGRTGTSDRPAAGR